MCLTVATTTVFPDFASLSFEGEHLAASNKPSSLDRSSDHQKRPELKRADSLFIRS